MPTFVDSYSGELTILVLFTILVVTLIIIVPQLLRAHLRKVEMKHQENIKALEKGLAVPPPDERSLLAGRTALLVPMVVMVSAAVVTCFLVAYKSTEHLFTVSLAIWVVAGVVSTAAITGGVALIGRLAQLQSGEREDDLPDNPLSP